MRAHEEGRLVFFCGAGISYPAGLPGFKDLVEKIYTNVGTTKAAIEAKAFEKDQFDATLDLLERRLPGQRIAMRKALVKSLKPKLRRKGAMDTHAALLRLARNADNTIRLVTTNFDTVFNAAAKREKLKFSTYSAPMLPIPKSSHWNGLVHLHGAVPSNADASALNRLVITSGDFGLAYLTERWAARFVSELFRNYAVCFVGYSINDPVLRYMMDALAADRMLGEVTQQAWALGDCEAGLEKQKTEEWSSKGVVPILYEVPRGTHDHSALHKTLHAWASTYRDGILGKEKIVATHALAKPSASTQQDNFVGRMLWALSDRSGMPAKRFAEYNPAPSLEWLFGALCDNRYGKVDLPRFDVLPLEESDENLKFSLICRPPPHTHALRMTLTRGASEDTALDNVMLYIARWLLRHLNDSDLVLWILQQGGRLHERWSFLIMAELARLDRMQGEGQTAELDKIRTNSPNAIPNKFMQTVWRMLFNRQLKSPLRQRELDGWISRFQRYGITATTRAELRKALEPRVQLSKPFMLRHEPETSTEPKRMSEVFDYEVVLAADDVQTTLRDLNGNEKWRAELPHLITDFQLLLRDCLDLLRELGDADEQRERSYLDLPSVSPHSQNRGRRNWVSLIELCRDAWLAVKSSDSEQASSFARDWFSLPYPTFKRLAFFAASHDDCIASELWVDWLTAKKSQWLWSSETTREVLRLLALQGRNLSSVAQGRLEAAILAGPPNRVSSEAHEEPEKDPIRDRMIWLRLVKLETSEVTLSAPARERLDNLTRAYPELRVSPNEREEFLIWSSGTGHPDYEDHSETNVAPSNRRELAHWLKQPLPDDDFYYQDTWSETCRAHLSLSFTALLELALSGVWPEVRWKEALQTWSEEKYAPRSWRYASSLLACMPDATFARLVRPISWWLEVVSKTISQREDVFINLCRRVLEAQLSVEVDNDVDVAIADDPIGAAINHPVGQITEALLNAWFARKPNDNDGLPDDIEPLLTQITNTKAMEFRHGRVILAAQSIGLYRVDKPWFELRMLSRFDWAESVEEARAVWSGFLWSPRIHWPLLGALKPYIFDTASHCSELGTKTTQFAAFLTYMALEASKDFCLEEFAAPIAELPQDGLEASAEALKQSLESAGGQREASWKNRILPFWQKVWPKSSEFITENIAEDLIQLIIAAGSEFPQALSIVQDWLMPIEFPNYLLQKLDEEGICRRFPEEALNLLSRIINGRSYSSEKLWDCLEAIVQVQPELAGRPSYSQLNNFVRYSRN
ncbi:anti-phage defense-associated sirtuin Dsr1 [Thioclava sp. GXIMD4216]|uniref:anti-phage defense-associated sirtuin Dsr1 n=1 Tax=Thioclava sp. GXIMD4216 TaxID=3131929 RepID=UPI0030D1EBD4